MKAILNFFLGIHVFLYRFTNGRLGGGLGSRAFGILLLTTTGRKSGKARTLPLGTFKDDENYVVIASNAGQPTHPAWFHNLQSNPNVELQVNDKQLKARAEIASSEKRSELWKRLIQLAPNYDNYTKQTTREIPLVLLKPIH